MLSIKKSFVAIATALAVMLGFLAAPMARAEVVSDETSIANAVKYLNAQDYTAPGDLADAIISLAAAGADTDALAEKLQEKSAGYATGAGALAKVMIAADAAGKDARTFVPVIEDAVETLKGYYDEPDNASVSFFNPHLAATALARLGEPIPDALLDAVLAGQDASGAFGYNHGGFQADPDYTAVGIFALGLIADSKVDSAETKATAKTALDKAIAWAQDPASQKTDDDGDHYWMTYSPANSTGLMAAALAEQGVDVSSPKAFLKKLQIVGEDEDDDWGGAWPASLDSTRPNTMASVQALMGVAGAGYGKAGVVADDPVAPEPGDDSSDDPTSDPTDDPTDDPTGDPTEGSKDDSKDGKPGKDKPTPAPGKRPGLPNTGN